VEEDQTGDEPERGVVSNGGIREPFLEAGDGGVLRDFEGRGDEIDRGDEKLRRKRRKHALVSGEEK